MKLRLQMKSSINENIKPKGEEKKTKLSKIKLGTGKHLAEIDYDAVFGNNK
jgi:hypothetical protein